MQRKEKTNGTIIIGKEIKITDSKNKTIIGIEGKVVDETKNTLTIKTDKGNKKIIKDCVTIHIDNKTIEGRKTTGRIDTRIKNS